jgi:hypothetical protein
MQVLLSQTNKTREERKEMKPITEFEVKFMNIFLESGIQMLPNSDRSAYNSDSDYEFVQFVTDRLIKFYSLYKVEASTEEVAKDW